jgi:hypothetical protein
MSQINDLEIESAQCFLKGIVEIHRFRLIAASTPSQYNDCDRTHRPGHHRPTADEIHICVDGPNGLTPTGTAGPWGFCFWSDAIPRYLSPHQPLHHGPGGNVRQMARLRPGRATLPNRTDPTPSLAGQNPPKPHPPIVLAILRVMYGGDNNGLVADVPCPGTTPMAVNLRLRVWAAPRQPTRLQGKVKKLGYIPMNVNGFDALDQHPVNMPAVGALNQTVQGTLESRADILPRDSP